MAEMRVWAPHAGRAELLVAGRRSDMAPQPGGWFQAAGRVPGGTDYTFSLDGGESLPDPRSPHQPSGVDGPSRTVDHTAFTWSDGDWRGRGLRGALIYEVHVGAFTEPGTFESTIQRLDHLVRLGVTHLELMPVGEFVGERGWGYDVVGFYAPHHAYGGPEGLKRLVDACHGRGLAVILDVVYNHVGDEGCYLPRFGPYLRHGPGGSWGHTFDLDSTRTRDVRDFLIESALGWLRDYHIDGLRLDAADRVEDASQPHFLAELAERVGELSATVNRRLLLIAESDLNDPVLLLARPAGGYGLDAQWLDDFQHALHALLTGERQGYYGDYGAVSDLARSMREAYVYAGRWSNFHGRVRGRPAGEISGESFVAFAQNHDQVGNRPAGERLSMLVDGGRLRLAAAVTLLSPFVPLVFMGEEWGARTPFLFFADHRQEEVIENTRRGRRRDLRTFGWEVEGVADPQDEATFLASRLDWSEPDREPHATLLEWYQDMIRQRRSRPELGDGDRSRIAVTADEAQGKLEMHRGGVRLLCDFRSGSVEVRVPPPPDRAG